MNTDDLLLDNLLDCTADGSILLDDLIQAPAWMSAKNLGNDAVEQALKENNIMEDFVKSEYQLFSAPLCGELDHLTPSTNYLDWINWGGNGENTETTGMASNSSDSGVSSDFHYDQQLSPSTEMDCSTPTHLEEGSVAGSMCSSVDVDNVSSPETLCPSSPCSDINSLTDDALSETKVSSMGTPLVLPVAIKDLNLREIKAVKIIRNGAASVLSGVKATAANVPDAIKKLLGPVQVSLATPVNASTNTKVNNNSGNSNQGSSYPPIVLTDEERRLLSKEGVELPTHYPLTKHEERELKRIRRKIRNKISAQDSRKRKRVYMDGLEDRVKHCTDENLQLQKRIRLLETENKSLVSQLKRLQSILTGHGNNTTNVATPAVAATATNSTATPTTATNPSGNSAQPATCLLVLLLSFALFLLPNLRPDQSGKSLAASDSSKEMAESLLSKMPPFAGRSRALLQDTLQLETDDEMDLDLEEMELDALEIGQEVVIRTGKDDDDEAELYKSVPVGPPVSGIGGLISAHHRGDISKPSQWEQKYGKQYPAFNGKRNVPSFLAEHDYPAYDPVTKRSRFKLKDELLSEVPAKEVNQSKVVEEQIGLVTEHQPAIVLRISEDL